MNVEQRDLEIRRLLPLVRAIARRLRRVLPAADLDDLIGDGCVGLIRAVDGFDPALGPSLEHYARRVVLGAMLNGIRRLDPVSERARRVIRYADRERYALAVERGAMPTQHEMDRRFPTLHRARADAHCGAPLSLDAALPPDARPVLDRSGDPALLVVAAGERQRVRAAVDGLPARQRNVVVAHYFADRPLRRLSAELRVSPQRVSQLHLAAIRRMREALVEA